MANLNFIRESGIRSVEANVAYAVATKPEPARAVDTFTHDEIFSTFFATWVAIGIASSAFYFSKNAALKRTVLIHS
jgi:hypothetical protein